MKKVYEIKAVEDNGYGYGTTKVVKRVYTTEEAANEMARTMADEIVARWPREWWMHYTANREGTPTVWAEVLEVEGL